VGNQGVKGSDYRINKLGKRGEPKWGTRNNSDSKGKGCNGVGKVTARNFHRVRPTDHTKKHGGREVQRIKNVKVGRK